MTDTTTATSTGSAVTSFLGAVFSGEAPPEVVAVRRAQCDACPRKIVEARGEFCGACRCPRSRLAELSRKLRFARLRCPLRRPGFINAET